MFSQLFPSKDATLYSAYPITNTGLDPILEFTKPDPYNASRILIQFDQTEIMNTLSNITATSTSSGSWEAYLRIYASQVESLPTVVPIVVNPVSQEWDQGTGRLANSPTTVNGASWLGPKTGSNLPLGKTEIKYNIKYSNFTQECKFEVNVMDNVKPKLLILIKISFIILKD